MEKKIEQGFFEYCEDDIIDYLEKCKSEYLYSKCEYVEKRKKIIEIKDKYPKIRAFIEGKEGIELTKIEMDNLLEIIRLEDKLRILEEKFLFKLGFKNACIFLR